MTLILHIVPHTHWDREWYLTFQQFRIRLVHLMDRLLDILAHEKSYRHFMLDGQTILLEDYLEIRPERAEEIARLVRAGRLSIGPWHVLPDEFLVAPESLVRNLLLGDRVCRRFGDKMPIGYVPDLFGHVSQMPQILSGFGIETAALRRGLAVEPAELWWSAPDGSRVLVCYLRDGYDNAARLPTTDAAAFVAAISTARESLAPYVSSGHLLLLAGTDHQEPQPELPMLIAYANDGRLGASLLVHSSLVAYVEAVREAIDTGFLEKPRYLDTVQGELRSPQRHHLLPGVLSTRVWIKQRNDAVETLLTHWAEPFAAWAELLDAEDSVRRAGLTSEEPLTRVRRPAALIGHAWRLLLENHPHDSICGCSVDQVHREMAPRFDQAEQIGTEITTQSLKTITDQVDTRHGRQPVDGLRGSQTVIIFNPSDGPRTDVVTARLRLPGPPDALEVVDDGGRVVPHQVMVAPVGSEPTLLQIEAAPESDLVFVAPDLPPFGYATFPVRPAQDGTSRDRRSERASGADALENELFLLQANPTDGTLTLTDKTSGVVYAGLNRFVDGGDRGDVYNYCQPQEDRLIAAPATPPTIRLIENGPARRTLEIAQVYRLPRALRPDRRGRATEPHAGPLAAVDVPIISRVSLYPGVRRVDIATIVDNRAQDHRLRVHFPVAAAVDHAHTEAHFHVARRPVPPLPSRDTNDWAEQPVPTVPQRGWADVSDGQVGLMVANRGLPEVEFIPEGDETVIALTLLRCVGWLSREDMHCRRGHAGPELPTPEAQCPGRHTFHYALIPHTGGWGQARAQAEAFRAPLRAVAAERHPGPLPPVSSLVQVEPPSFGLTAIKQPEKGSDPGLLVRGVNLSDQPATVRLRPWRNFDRAARVNLNEEFVEPLSPADGGAVTFPARPWEIVTVKWGKL
jgi:alpha-mannosidase